MSPQATVELEAGRDVATAQAPAPSQATKGWTKYDTGWMLSLFGTAIGAGILYLPINAGAGGLWPLLIVTALIGPMTYLSHRGLSRLVCASPRSGGDITVAVRDYFGQGAGKHVGLGDVLVACLHAEGRELHGQLTAGALECPDRSADAL